MNSVAQKSFGLAFNHALLKINGSDSDEVLDRYTSLLMTLSCTRIQGKQMVDSSASFPDDLVASDLLLRQVKRLKRSRASGGDGFTVEYLNSLSLGGRSHSERIDI